MHPEYKRALTEGSIIFKNIFETERGEYALVIIKHKAEYYLAKYKNRKIVFVNRLSNMKEMPING